MNWLGIDPGGSGGIAMILHNGEISVSKMPETLEDMRVLIAAIAMATPIFALLEKVHSMPGQGVASSFKFGRNFGNIEALLIGRLPFDYVSPQKWQKAMGCMTHGDKNISKAAAQRLFPQIKKITHATADALLIAEYCRRTHGALPDRFAVLPRDLHGWEEI